MRREYQGHCAIDYLPTSHKLWGRRQHPPGWQEWEGSESTLWVIWDFRKVLFSRTKSKLCSWIGVFIFHKAFDGFPREKENKWKKKWENSPNTCIHSKGENGAHCPASDWIAEEGPNCLPGPRPHSNLLREGPGGKSRCHSLAYLKWAH